MNATDQELIQKVNPLELDKNIAYNVRKNGKAIIRNITEDVSIVTKEDGSGIDIYVKENTKDEK